jgi:hypothetical protein
MDYNEYATIFLVRERHAELVAAARRESLIRGLSGPRRTVRATLGTVLIRLGAWLLREAYPATAAR